MGKHWNRRGRASKERGLSHPGHAGRAAAAARRESAASLAAATRGGAAGYERRVESACSSKRTYRTLEKTAAAKRRFDGIYGDASHVYKCEHCGMYHLTRKEGGPGAIADRFLPASRVDLHGPYHERLADAMAARGMDASQLASALGVAEPEVRSWLAGDPAGAFRAPDAARVLGVGVADLL